MFIDDIQLFRKFSDMKFQSVIWKSDKKIEIPLLAKASYRRIGVFIDLRCQRNEKVKLALTEVRKNISFSKINIIPSCLQNIKIILLQTFFITF